jgi:hypothetical protein
MADAVTTKVIQQTAHIYVAHFTNISDGTGESAVVKVDKSALTNASDGAEAGSVDIERIAWTCDGMTVRVLWDHDTDDLAFVCSGTGMVDFTHSNDPVLMNTSGLLDPRSTGGTGDILFTTNGHTAGDTYSITLWLRKNPA